jgi:hypothetical protein
MNIGFYKNHLIFSTGIYNLLSWMGRRPLAFPDRSFPLISFAIPHFIVLQNTFMALFRYCYDCLSKED